MNAPTVIIGIGELGSVFARAFLRAGHPVTPITRNMDMTAEAAALQAPLLVLVAVAEKDFHAVMDTLPGNWRSRLALLQNELLPRDWEAHHIDDPTVISVWFEKKRGMDYNVLLPSPVYGSRANFIAAALGRIDLPCRILGNREDLIFELVLKNVFVFTINICGLVLAEGATTTALWQEHRDLALAVADDVITLQEFLTGRTFSRERLIEGLLTAIQGDPHHKCRGRSARGRLGRAIESAQQAGLEIAAIRDIQRRLRG